MNRFIRQCTLSVALLCATPSWAQEKSLPIFDVAKTAADKFKTEKATLSLTKDAQKDVIEAEFPGGNGYPGFDFPASVDGWDLAAFAGVQIQATNKGTSPIQVALRLDNAGDWKSEPFNTESQVLQPGESKFVRVNFGKSYGGQPGYALDAAKISAIKVFAINPTQTTKVVFANLQAVGTPPPKPVFKPTGTNTNVPPISGELLSQTDKLDFKRFVSLQSTVRAADAKTLRLEFSPGAQGYPKVEFPVPVGGWNLSTFGGVSAQVTNVGSSDVRLFLRVDNPGEWKDSPWNTESLTLKPKETKIIKVNFGKNGEGAGFPLNPETISGIQFFTEKPGDLKAIEVRDLKGFGSPSTTKRNIFSTPKDRDVPVVPAAWVGTRPPVEGNWVQTLNENFDGTKLDEKIWRYETWWNGLISGQTQRYSKDNTTLENGILKIKTEKKRGHQNDNPTLPQMDYTSGHIITYDKWNQAYGYFEARVKLPTARGLWPAFWLMPDRGEAAGPEGWKRESTKDGGMEFDILEHLAEWGPGRNNVAVHWDGYEADHKSWGDAANYYGPTPDGWHTFGMLWEPGKLEWFIDGIKKNEFVNERVGRIPAYILLNVQMGGWATKDVDNAKLPDDFLVDWVRVWQRKERVKP